MIKAETKRRFDDALAYYDGQEELRKLAADRDRKRESFKLSLWAFRRAGGFLGYVRQRWQRD